MAVSKFEANNFRRIPSGGVCNSNIKSGDTLTVESGGSLVLASGAIVSSVATVETAAAADTITLAESGKIFFLALAGGFTLTLPAVTPAGTVLTFIVKTAPTTAYIILSTTNDNIIGYPIASLGSDETANGNAAGDQLNFVANVALPGDRADFVSDGTSWHVRATVKATGAVTITG